MSAETIPPKFEMAIVKRNFVGLFTHVFHNSQYEWYIVFWLVDLSN